MVNITSTLDAVASLYHGGSSNVSWERALDGLSADQACSVPPGLPHSVAGVVGHLDYWNTYLLRVFRGEDPAEVTSAAQGWPSVTPHDWPGLHERLLHSLDTLAAHARDEAFLELLDRRGRPRLVPLTNFAGHGLYHLGQVVTIRQALGAWPPPGGGDSW